MCIVTHSTFVSHLCDKLDIMGDDDHRISTITCHTSLKHDLPIDILKHFLPVQWDVSPGSNEFIHPRRAGVILFLRGYGIQRGNYEHLREATAFRNSISLDMSIASKMINLKVSTHTVHMCGIKCVEQIHETMKHLHNLYQLIYNYRDYWCTNPSQAENHLSTFLRECKGSKQMIDIPVDGEDTIEVKYYGIRIPSQGVYPDSLYNYWVEAVKEWQYHHQVCHRLRTISRDIVSVDMDYLESFEYTTHISMMNFSRSLGFQVNLLKLRNYINGLNDPSMRAIYDALLEYKLVKVLVYVGDTRHSFMIYGCGNVTQSGQGEMPDVAYRKLIPLIRSMRYLVEQVEPARNFKRAVMPPPFLITESVEWDDNTKNKATSMQMVLKSKVVW